MKYLSEYIEENQTAIFNKYGVFFAFSNKQFDEAKEEGVKYVSMKMGMICPEKNVQAFTKELHECHKAGIKQDLAENGSEKIIIRELYNHETFYTDDISQVVWALSPYKITEKEVLATYQEERPRALELA